MSTLAPSLLAQLDHLDATQLRRLLVDQLTRQKIGLYWEHDAIERDRAQNEHVVLPRVVPALCHRDASEAASGASAPFANLIIEGDNFDSLRLLRATHSGKIRVIYIDPPYNTGNKDWVYNDHYVGANDRWRHSMWLEFLYQRLTLARDLLAPDGVILVSINDENRSRLELLMDEVFPGRRIGSLVWRTRDTTSAKDANFSDVHEHVLAYGGAGFAFRGREKVPTKYKNPDNDPDGPWNGDPLTLAFDRFQRPNLYYPLRNPKTDVWYPCDENSVWRYATEARVSETKSLQAETIEEFVRLGRILFPDALPAPSGKSAKTTAAWQEASRVVVWQSLDELLAAIDRGDVPVTPKRRRPLLSRDTPNLEFWVNKKVAFGRPLFKKHWKFLRSHVNPLGSWIARLGEDDDEDTHTLRSPQAGEGTEAIQEIFGSKAFQYPKPPRLIRELLAQAAREDDIVLDFFAGSGTTGQAVLELNAEDGGNRRFILCSSTEVTEAEPDRNICRDVCAERMRRVMAGYGGKQGLGGNFAYLQVDKLEPPDVAFDARSEHARALLAMRLTHSALPPGDAAVQLIARDAANGIDTVLVSEVDDATLDALLHWPSPRLAVYSNRPDSVRELLQERGRSVNSYSLVDALLRGQARHRAAVAPDGTQGDAVPGGAQ